MIRTFSTHKIRKQKELTGCLWDFSPCQGPLKGIHYPVFTPCCFENHPDFSNYQGEGDYTTSFQSNGPVRLVFKGVSHTATIFLDGREIAHHYNAYTPFDVILPDLSSGLHTLTVRADNRFSPKSALHIPNDYMSYGGVSRPVVLEEISSVYLKWIHVTPFKKEQWNAKIEILLENITASAQTVQVTAQTAGTIIDFGEQTISGNASLTISKEISFESVSEWSEDSPVLYEISAQIAKKGIVLASVKSLSAKNRFS